MRLAITSLALIVAVSSFAGAPVNTSAPFELGAWVALEHTEGPVVLHRIRVVEQSAAITKSTIFRPTGSEYLRTVQIQLEYSNSATRDWKAVMHVEWLDADGKAIDGYRGSESLDDRESHDITTITLSTLRYGLDRAKTLKIFIEPRP